jgi:hypothetical protein
MNDFRFGRRRIAGAVAGNKKPGAESRPGACREFQFQELR